MTDIGSPSVETAERKPIDREAPMNAIPLEERVDGGRRAWLSLLGAWMILFSTFGSANAFGVFQDFYLTAGLASASNISWIGSVQIFLQVAVGLPAGQMLLKGWFHQVVLVGSVIYVFSAFMLSLADPNQYYQIFLSQALGMGIGSGLLYLPVLTVTAQHWKVHRSLAMGTVMTGTCAGAIVFSIMLNQLFNDGTGFAWAVRYYAFIMSGMLAIANCITSPGVFHLPTPDQTVDVMSVLRDMPYTLANIGIAFALAGVYFPYFYLQVAALLHGVSKGLSFYIIAIMNGVSIFGRIACGRLADRYGVFNVMAPACFLCGALTLVMLHVHSAATAVVLAVLFGISSGGFFALLGPTTVALTRFPAEFGLKMALGFGITSIGTLPGTPLDGVLITGDRWWRAALFSSMMFFVATALIVVSGALVYRRKRLQGM